MDTATATRIARLIEAGAPAADELLPLVYDELRALAASHFQRERGDHTLQPTAVVHEAWMRLADLTRIDWQGRTHFLAVGAVQIRRVLVDHARRRDAAKRGGHWHQVTLGDELSPSGAGPVDLLALDEALTKLGATDQRQGRVVELRIFGGLTNEEAASVIGMSPRTAAGDWRMARAWLRRELGGSTRRAGGDEAPIDPDA